MALKKAGISLGVWGIVLVIMVQQIASMNHGCENEDCVPLNQCSTLVRLLRKPSTSNIRTLQAATCYIEDAIPMVCCRPKTRRPIINSLLPSRPGTCGQGTTGGLQRILGGEEAPINAYPWIVAMGYSEIGFKDVEYLCAGSIIHEKYILTAAHCVAPDIMAFKNLEVITIGDWDLATDLDCQLSASGLRFCAPPSQNFTYEEIIIHPKYNTRAPHSDDIALIRLSSAIDLSGRWVHPVCLPPQGLSARRVVGDREAVVAGWGTTESGQGSSRLLHVLIPIESNTICNATYSGTMVKEQICFGGNIGKDSCAGDSGGPLVVGGPGDQPPFLQIGIVSYGPSSCGLESVPGVYTSVSHYRDWIDINIKP